MAAERLMLAFSGTQMPETTGRMISSRPIAGVTLFRHHNVESASQVRALTGELQAAAAPDARPLLVATDQEGGQLIALGEETTPFAGPMALGATGDTELAERVARATARELRALGVNVNYAPACDLATNPSNPALGIRSFGDEPAAVAGMAAAMVRGLQAEGIAATLKHFPGAGEAAVDTHHGLAHVEADRHLLAQRELVPFVAGVEAGARLVMAGHFATPALSGDADLPASLSRAVIHDLLRDEMGFDGLAITDALDMRALAQGAAQVVDVITAVRAGQDLLLATPDEDLITRLDEGLEQAERRGLVERDDRRQVARRLADLRAWLAGFDQPPLDVVGCSEHRALAAELATRSVTLVRNDDRLLPLAASPNTRVAVVHAHHADLTPADTSSWVTPTLADAIRRRLPRTDELLVPARPAPDDIAAVRARLAEYDLVVVGTIAAHLQPEHAALAQAVLDAGRPTVTVALRTPWDLPTYPSAATHVCSFGILAPTTEALAAAMFGERPFSGRLPVELAGSYARGQGLAL